MMKKFYVSIILLCLSCGGGGPEQTQAVPPDVKTVTAEKSILMVIAPKDFRDEEFKEPYDLFTQSGMRVVVASTDTVPVQGTRGMVVTPHITLEQVNPDSFDALVIVGGPGCEMLWDNTTLHTIVQGFDDSKKTIGAICIAPVVLARAGVLKGKNATVYPSVMQDICDCGAQYEKKDVVVYDNIITSSGPQSATDFATTIVNRLSQ